MKLISKFKNGSGAALAFFKGNLSSWFTSVIYVGLRGLKTAGKVYKFNILEKGCFVKDTSLLMANNPFKNVVTGMALAVMPLVTPIHEVQLLDYTGTSAPLSDRSLALLSDRILVPPVAGVWLCSVTGFRLRSVTGVRLSE